MRVRVKILCPNCCAWYVYFGHVKSREVLEEMKKLLDQIIIDRFSQSEFLSEYVQIEEVEKE